MSSDLADIAQQLTSALGPLRRAVSRETRAMEGLPDLPDNQIEVLRAVLATPGLGTSAIAARLQLARPTVSNLLNAMKRAGLVDLSRTSADARLVEVFATEEARELLGLYDRASERVLAGIVARLEPDQQIALRAALPVLTRLNDLLRCG